MRAAHAGKFGAFRLRPKKKKNRLRGKFYTLTGDFGMRISGSSGLEVIFLVKAGQGLMKRCIVFRGFFGVSHGFLACVTGIKAGLASDWWGFLNPKPEPPYVQLQ